MAVAVTVVVVLAVASTKRDHECFPRCVGVGVCVCVCVCVCDDALSALYCDASGLMCWKCPSLFNCKYRCECGTFVIACVALSFASAIPSYLSRSNQITVPTSE
jgi:hypothetical protein